MDEGSQSPRIGHLCWGRLEVAGRGAFKDAKLYPGGAREWNWREIGPATCRAASPPTGRSCSSAAQRSWCSRGMLGRLQICSETPALLERQGIPARVLPTGEAVRLDNDLAAKDQVGGLFHSTC